jgi:hypothetical protein
MMQLTLAMPASPDELATFAELCRQLGTRTILANYNNLSASVDAPAQPPGGPLALAPGQPESEPEVAPESEPEVAPESEPEVAPESEPEVAPDPEPEVAPKEEGTAPVPEGAFGTRPGCARELLQYLVAVGGTWTQSATQLALDVWEHSPKTALLELGKLEDEGLVVRHRSTGTRIDRVDLTPAGWRRAGATPPTSADAPGAELDEGDHEAEAPRTHGRGREDGRLAAVREERLEAAAAAPSGRASSTAQPGGGAAPASIDAGPMQRRRFDPDEARRRAADAL